MTVRGETGLEFSSIRPRRTPYPVTTVSGPNFENLE